MRFTTIDSDEATTRPQAWHTSSDPHGQAGLLLAESILHALIEAKVLTLAQAISAVQTAADVTSELAVDADEAGAGRIASPCLLSAIERSLAAGGIKGASSTYGGVMYAQN